MSQLLFLEIQLTLWTCVKLKIRLNFALLFKKGDTCTCFPVHGLENKYSGYQTVNFLKNNLVNIHHFL